MEQDEHIPALVEDWTWDTIVHVVKKHEFEPSLYDFKDVLHPTGDQAHRDRHIDSIRRTACSMANTDGGFILFGVQDRKKSISTPEDRIKGFSVQGDLRKEFGEKIMPLQPDVYFDAVLVRLSHEATKGVFVVHISQSSRRPHMVSSTGIYYRRGEGGHAVTMNHYEVREQMINTEERLRKVTLLRLEIRQYLELIQTMLDAGNVVVRMLYRLDTSAFKVLLADTCSLFPTADNLLSLLLRIPSQATMINNYLERTSHPSQPAPMNVSPEYYQADVEGIRTNLGNFRDYCLFCENRLNALFGPLEAGGPVTMNDIHVYGPQS
jgi:hypothetical protein